MGKSTSRLAILAGAGVLPQRLAQACRDAGREFHVFAFEGAADPAWLPDVPHRWVSLGRPDELLDCLREEGCRDIVMAGRVVRPDLRSLRPSARLVGLVSRVLLAARKGDGAIIDAVVAYLESEGFRVGGAETVLADLLAPIGMLTRIRPDEADRRDIRRAATVVSALGALDVGQGAVVRDGLVLAVEAAEGTDAMLERCRAFRASAPGGVLVKLTKPAQERRVDLPTLGVATVTGAAAAGLKGIAFEGRGALIVDRPAVVAAADAAGLFLCGVILDAARNPVLDED